MKQFLRSLRRCFSVRFRVRTLILAVALVALALWSVRMWNLSARYRQEADFDAYGVTYFLEAADHPRSPYCFPPNPGEEEQRAEQWRKYKVQTRVWCLRMAQFFAEMNRKYDHAAACPWIRVEPDPPWPD
jgi:hypothetical protein